SHWHGLVYDSDPASHPALWSQFRRSRPSLGPVGLGHHPHILEYSAWAVSYINRSPERLDYRDPCCNRRHHTSRYHSRSVVPSHVRQWRDRRLADILDHRAGNGRHWHLADAARFTWAGQSAGGHPSAACGLGHGRRDLVVPRSLHCHSGINWGYRLYWPHSAPQGYTE